MIDEQDVVDIVRRELEALEAAKPPVCQYVQLMPVTPFDAVFLDEQPVLVLGVALRDDGVPEWIARRAMDDGALVPEIIECVWPVAQKEAA